MNFQTKYKVVLLKRYFDQGYATTSYIKWVMAIMGLGNAMITQNLKVAMILGVAYGIFCFLFGLWWIRSGWFTAEVEVGNQYNLFVKEMRELSGSPINRKV